MVAVEQFWSWRSGADGENWMVWEAEVVVMALEKEMGNELSAMGWYEMMTS